MYECICVTFLFLVSKQYLVPINEVSWLLNICKFLKYT